MIRCAECLFWGDKPAFTDNPDLHRCTNEHLLARGECEPGDLFNGKPGIATFPEFGCVQGVKK